MIVRCGIVLLSIATLIGCSPAPAPAPKAVPVARVHTHADADHHDHDHSHDHGHDDGDDHDHGDMAHLPHDTLGEALAELKKVCSAARAELTAKNLEKADGHVHMVGHLLDDMHRLLEDAKLPEEPQAAAKKALDDVFESFDALDSALHSSDEKVRSAIEYLEHEPKINAAIESLERIVTVHGSEAGHAHEADE
ncbi:MAG: hypothetical protein ACKOYJ_12515 [Planctomycetia bacterium]